MQQERTMASNKTRLTRLHLLGLALTLLAAVPEWRQAGVWFCGPAGFGARLREGLLANGMIAGRWHQELFEMR